MPSKYTFTAMPLTTSSRPNRCHLTSTFPRGVSYLSAILHSDRVESITRLAPGLYASPHTNAYYILADQHTHARMRTYEVAPTNANTIASHIQCTTAAGRPVEHPTLHLCSHPGVPCMASSTLQMTAPAITVFRAADISLPPMLADGEYSISANPTLDVPHGDPLTFTAKSWPISAAHVTATASAPRLDRAHATLTWQLSVTRSPTYRILATHEQTLSVTTYSYDSVPVSLENHLQAPITVNGVVLKEGAQITLTTPTHAEISTPLPAKGDHRPLDYRISYF